LEDGRGFEGENDGRDDDEDDSCADPPDVEAIAAEVVGESGDHGGLQGVEGGGGEGDDHHKDDTDGPGGELLEEVEKSDAAILVRVCGVKGPRPGCDEASGANEGYDYEGYNSSNGDADPEIFVSLGGEGSDPKVREEEVVCEDGHGEDVEELPA